MARKVDKEGTEKRKEQILKAAGECFSEKGFHQSGMADICKRAGLSPGTVYHYFRSKDDMIMHFAEQELAEAEAFAEAILQADTIEEMVSVVVDGILESDGHEELQFYLEILSEGGRNRKIGKVLRKSEEVMYFALQKKLKKLGAKGSGAKAGMLAMYVAIQIGALEIYKVEEPPLKECREMARLSRKGLLHVLTDQS